MKKTHVKHLKISDKIYISKEDIVDINELESLFTYYNGEEFISTFSEKDDIITLPSNGYFKLSWDTVEDNRQYEKLPYNIKYSGNLRSEQQEAVDKLFRDNDARSGLLQAKPGFGKTYTLCNLIARNQTKTLILVHTKLLYKQWINELNQQLPDQKIGQVGDGSFDIQDITVAIYKTVYNKLEQFKEKFSTVIVDEAHKCPARMFSEVVNNINAKVKIAATATPKRKDGKHVFLNDFFSPYRVVAVDSRTLAVPKVEIVKTDFPFTVFDPKAQWSRTITKLGSDDSYIQFIANIIIEKIGNKRCPLVIGERVQFLKELQKIVPKSVVLIGESDEEHRKDVLENMGTKYSSVFSTKLFDEGISCHRLDTLILPFPSNNPTQWEQRIGRIEREHPDAQHPLIVDIHLKGAIVNRQQTRRLEWYQSNGYNIL